MKEASENNDYYQLAVSYVNCTNKNIYLTGKAGTGKTTFLKYIRDHCHKKLVVAAPTGVAAMNAGGVTLHSLFQLPIAGFIPDPSIVSYPPGEFHDRRSLLQHLRLNRSKRSLLQELELLIIDEVSMLRADILDAIDTILRSVRRQPTMPFGGVQVLFIGDLFQLPPVTRNHEWSILKHHYRSPSFFAAKVLANPPVYIELKKIYRQSEERFIEILNRIRNCKMEAEDLQFLNSHYQPNFEPEHEGQYITLTTHNVNAEVINKEHLKTLEGKMSSFEAVITGEFNENSVSAEMELNLKEGAQIMFIRNDKGDEPRYYNGKIGIVDKIENENIRISFTDGSDSLSVVKEEWQNVRYTLNEETKELEENIKGTFTQFPIRLAWAITIHKSQGLTFDMAIIDAGDSFAPGQVYVALSRLTSLNGLVLKSKIREDGISSDASAIEFSAHDLPSETLETLLEKAQREYISSIILQVFDYTKLRSNVVDFVTDLDSKTVPNKEKTILLMKDVGSVIMQQQQTGAKFIPQLKSLLEEANDDGYTTMHERVEAAVNYFTSTLQKSCLEPLQKYYDGLKVKSRVKKHLHEVSGLIESVQQKNEELNDTLSLTMGLIERKDLVQTFENIATERKSRRIEKSKAQIKVKRKKGDTQRLTLQMYKDGKTLEEIAELRELTETTVHGHLLSFIGTEFELNDLISEEKVKAIMNVIETNKEASTGEIKNTLGEKFSYGEIGAVVKYLDAD